MRSRPFSERPVDKTDAELLRGLDDLRRQLREEAESAHDGRRPGGDLLRHFPLAGLDDARGLLLDLMRDGACVLSTDGNVIHCNRAFAHMLGRAQDEVAGATVFDLLKDDDRGAIRTLMSPAARADRAEVTFCRADGRERRAEAIVQPTTLYGFRAWCLLTRDLTEQRRLTDIVKGDELARIVFEQAAEAVVVCDADGKVLRANRRAAALAGVTPDLMPIDTAFHFLVPNASRRFEVLPILLRGALVPFEADLPGPGRRVHLLLNAGRINNAAGEFLGWVVTLTDISTRVAAERESRDWAAREKDLNESLQRQAGELRTKNQELEQFAFVASHDLQEPLRKINAFGDLLEEHAAAMSEQGRDYLGRIKHAAHRMSLLIDDLLQYARATPRGEDLEPVDLAAAVRETLSQLDVLIDQNGVKVNVEPLPTVRAVRSLLQPLFSNLIGNAVKYRGQEPPVIRIGARRDGEKWEVWVADNGIGIDPQHSDRIFRLFERLHTRKQYLGTGIGLAICKRIVEIHGGRIWVESAPGQGATFRFTLPA